MSVNRVSILVRARHAIPWLLATIGLVASFSAEASSGVTISGTPPTNDVAGQLYSFTPSAADTRQRRLYFRIYNKPVWASFSSSTGKLSGTPAAANIGTTSNIKIRVTDGISGASLAPFSVTVTAAPPPSASLTISGTPPTSITAGSSYSFQPVAKDSSGKAVTFSIQSKPSWASFNNTTGMLSGTPTATQDGTYSGVTINVSDGTLSANLPAFAITVTSPTTTGTATVSWIPPTQNSDGTALTNLAGYQIDYGTSASSLSHTVKVANPGQTSYNVTNLTSGTWYFTVQSYTNTGVMSALANVASKTLP